MPFVVASFYHFFDFADYTQKRAPLLALLKDQSIKGSILMASEGFNGTISGTRESIDTVLAYVQEHIAGSNFEHKESVHDTQPFGRAKVRLKKETISLGVPADPTRVGAYVEPRDWDALISAPDTVLLDARNLYETHLGMFKGAIDPRTKNFKQLPDFIDKTLHDKKQAKIATYCTGGIRCEKLTSWLLTQGFEQVYHLKGGVLKYLEEIPEAQSSWQGECYVFDERVAVGHGLVPSATTTMCGPCGHALTPDDRASTRYKEGISCPHCA